MNKDYKKKRIIFCLDYFSKGKVNQKLYDKIIVCNTFAQLHFLIMCMLAPSRAIEIWGKNFMSGQFSRNYHDATRNRNCTRQLSICNGHTMAKVISKCLVNSNPFYLVGIRKAFRSCTIYDLEVRSSLFTRHQPIHHRGSRITLETVFETLHCPLRCSILDA